MAITYQPEDTTSVDLTKAQIRLIIDSLRANEKLSRAGFNKWLSHNVGIVSVEEVQARVQRMDKVLSEFVNLRIWLGDSKPVRES